MTDNVIPFGGITRLDLPVQQVLEAAKSRCSGGVVILGYEDDGSHYFASSMADGGEVVWLLEMAKKLLLEIGDNEA